MPLTPEEFTREELMEIIRDPAATPQERAEAAVMYRLRRSDKPFLTELTSGWGDILELIGGAARNPLIRVPAVALGGTLAEAEKPGPIDPDALKKRLATNLALEAIFPGVGMASEAAKPYAKSLAGGLSRILPEGGLQLSLRLGGMKGTARDFTKAVETFLREREAGGFFGGIAPGSSGRALTRKDALQAETRRILGEISPTAGHFRVGDVVGDVPMGIRSAIKAVEKGRDPLAMARLEANTTGTIFEELMKIGGERLQALKEAMKEHATFLKSYPEPLSLLDLQKLKQGQQARSRALIGERAARGGGLEVGKDVAELLAAARGTKLRDVIEEFAPAVREPNRRTSDILDMLETMEHLRGHGGVLRDTAGLSVSGGLGGALGLAFGHPVVGGLVGMGLLSPRILTGTTFAAGRAAEALPTLYRAEALSRKKDEPRLRRAP